MLAAGREESAQARAALGTLCDTYWPPLYAFLRRSGCSPHEAEDVVQGFFARLLDKGDLAQVGPERGRFRSFLLAAVKHFLANERDRARALKRGGGQNPLSLDLNAVEAQFAAESSLGRPPEATFDRQWALTLLDRVRYRLREEFAGAGKSERFQLLEPFLSGEPEASYREVAHALGLSENAVKVAVHRFRQRFREILRAEIAQTVATEAEIDEEIHHLFEALRK